MTAKVRCAWVGTDPIYQRYHDEEWGTPLHADRRLFEFLILEGAQAGLSWLTVLRKRNHYRRAFAGFDPQKVARFGPKKIAALLLDPGLIRNRRKIEAAVRNARAFLRIQGTYGSFDTYLWEFVHGKPVQNAWQRVTDIPAATHVSTALCHDLKQRGFAFVGPVVCYAFMQAVGMANDHTVDCFRYGELRRDTPRASPRNG